MKRLLTFMLIGFVGLMLTSCHCSASILYHDGSGGLEMAFEVPQPIVMSIEEMVLKAPVFIISEKHDINTIESEIIPEVVYMGNKLKLNSINLYKLDFNSFGSINKLL